MSKQVYISADYAPNDGDQEVIDAADEHNMVMVFTGMRHFRH